jgi:microcystin-dependent protein
MSDPFLGQIITVGFNFAPYGWAFCNGQIMSIAQNDALYSLLGTTFGGDGVQTFGLPNLMGRVPVDQGQGPNLSNYVMGQTSGTESITLQTSELPSHTHTAVTSNNPGKANTPSNTTILSDEGPTSTQTVNTYVPFSSPQPLVAGTIGPSGGNAPHENRQPFLAINFVIALQGIYPQQS